MAEIVEMKSLGTVKELRNNLNMMIRKVISREAEIFGWRYSCVLGWWLFCW